MYFEFSDEWVIAALREDLGAGDLTSQFSVRAGTRVQGHFIVKQPGVICGLPLLQRIFKILDPEVQVTIYSTDGKHVAPGVLIAQVAGNAHAILAGERVALNYLQHLSGIATKTAHYVEMVKGTQLKIADTRKTIPGMRAMAKYAVRVGGGYNHRMDLAGGILIKDNHIRAAGGITKAVKAARLAAPLTLKIEVEAESLLQVEEAVQAGADIIMLDNMDLDTMRKAVVLINGRAITEASGNMDQKNLREVAATGVDFVSIGGLTNNVQPLDISLRLI